MFHPDTICPGLPSNALPHIGISLDGVQLGPEEAASGDNAPAATAVCPGGLLPELCTADAGVPRAAALAEAVLALLICGMLRPVAAAAAVADPDTPTAAVVVLPATAAAVLPACGTADGEACGESSVCRSGIWPNSGTCVTGLTLPRLLLLLSTRMPLPLLWLAAVRCKASASWLAPDAGAPAAETTPAAAPAAAADAAVAAACCECSTWTPLPPALLVASALLPALCDCITDSPVRCAPLPVDR